MITITTKHEIDLVLEKYKGADAKIWAFKLTHSKMFLRLSLPGNTDIVYVVAAGCLHMAGPFSWSNADLSVIVEDEVDSEIASFAVDKSAGFKLITSAGIILAKGMEKEFAEYFEANI